MTTLALIAMLCALVPATLFWLNLREYRVPAQSGPSSLRPVPCLTLIIPARNEDNGIAAALYHALASTDIELELIVLNDHSTDDTASIVSAIAAQDPRVRLIEADALPTGWNGKQHACWQGANAATHGLLCFVDADVRLAPTALADMAAFLRHTDAHLVSGFPYQQTETFLEQLLLPFIHFILLGLLPMRAMARSTRPDLAAGCGQFLLCRRDTYFAAGGHSAIRQTMHDGLVLPRLFRQHGHMTRLADLTQLATCRMYTNAVQVWNGLTKNATEGMATPILLPALTLLFFFGQILPLPLLAFAVAQHNVSASTLGLAALLLAYLPRILSVMRFRQPALSAVLHPFGITVLLVLQWNALIRKALGRPATWKQRSYSAN